MTDMDYQLRSMRKALAQEEEILAVISNQGNHAEIKRRVEQLKADIKRLEDWNESQKAIRGMK